MKLKQIIGTAWYIKSEWEKMKNISMDKDIFEKTFEEWEQHALKSFNNLKLEKFKVEKVYIKSEEFFTWCKFKGLTCNAKSRSKYTAERISQK